MTIKDCLIHDFDSFFVTSIGIYCQIVAYLFLLSYDTVFMLTLSHNSQAGVIEAFNSTSIYI